MERVDNRGTVMLTLTNMIPKHYPILRNLPEFRLHCPALQPDICQASRPLR